MSVTKLPTLSVNLWVSEVKEVEAVVVVVVKTFPETLLTEAELSLVRGISS